jgi:hypothetical protein
MRNFLLLARQGSAAQRRAPKFCHRQYLGAMNLPVIAVTGDYPSLLAL